MGYITRFTQEERKKIINEESFENTKQGNTHELLTKIINEIRSGISMKDELSKKITFINLEKMIEILNNHNEDNYLYEEFYKLSNKIPKSTNPVPSGAPATKDTFYSNIKNKEEYINYALRCYKNGKNDMLDHLFSFIEKEKDEDMILSFIECNKEIELFKSISKSVTSKSTENEGFIKKIKAKTIPIIFDYSNLKTYTECLMNETVCVEDYKYLLDNLHNIDSLVKEEEFSDFLDFFIFKINHARLFPQDNAIHLNTLVPVTEIIKIKSNKSELGKSKCRLIEIIEKLKSSKNDEKVNNFFKTIKNITIDEDILI